MVVSRAEITLYYVIDIDSVIRYYLLQSSTLAKPSKPTVYPPAESWSTVEPTYTAESTNSLYFVDCTVFCDGSFKYSDVSFSSSYEAAKDAYNKAESLETRVTTAETNIVENSELIELAATKTEVTESLSGYYSKEDVDAALALQAEQMELKFTQTTQEIQNVNTDLQEKFNTITKYFTFDINGLTIGAVDNPNKVIIDNDEVVIEVNGVPVQRFDSTGQGLIPRLNVTTSFDLLGLVFTKDETGNINAE